MRAPPFWPSGPIKLDNWFSIVEKLADWTVQVKDAYHLY